MSAGTVGIIASLLTMFSFFPQIAKAIKKRSVRDLSLITLIQLCAGVSLWILYGALRKDAIIIVANSVTLFSLAVLLSLYLIFRKASS